VTVRRRILLAIVCAFPSRPDVRAVTYPMSEADRVRRGLVSALAGVPGVDVEVNGDGVRVTAAPRGRLVGAERGAREEAV
jgi:hypothetical protein